MIKLLTVFLLSFTTLFSPVKEDTTVVQPLSYQVETAEEETTFTETAYLYYENDVEYIIVLTSDSEVVVQMTYPDGTMDTFEGVYLFPGEVLSVLKGGNIWKQFTVNEDDITLSLYTLPVGGEGENNTEVELETFIEKLFQKEEFSKFISAFIAYLTANLGAIVIFIITTLRNKLKNIDKDTLFKELQLAKDEVEIKLRKEYEAKFDAYQAEIVGTLKSLENKVLGKIDSNEMLRKEELAKQTLELETTIKAVQKKASIDEILSE